MFHTEGMADMRLVFNTTPYSVVVSQRGRRVLGNSFDTIDITEPRAQKYLANGTLILVVAAPVEAEPAPEPDKSVTTDPEPEPVARTTAKASKTTNK